MAMEKYFKKRGEKAGLPPGTPVFVGVKKMEQTKIKIIAYDESKFEEKVIENVGEFFFSQDSKGVTWINVDGIHQVEIIEEIGKKFELHPLVVEDIVNTEQRPKIEDFGNYAFIVLKMLIYEDEKKDIRGEQVSLILGKNFVISFKEKEEDIFEPVRERIRNGKGRIRKMGADYLFYVLIDSIVDYYFIILEKIGDYLEEVEEKVVTQPEKETFNELNKLKRELIFLRKSVWPLREVISGLERGDSSLIERGTRIFLRDVYDHTIQVIDTVETFRDIVSGMHDTYLTSITNRTNEIMKVLTIIATLFIPLSFITGIYGMNFEYMPELKMRWAYFTVWGVFVGISVLMLGFFKKKKWL